MTNGGEVTDSFGLVLAKELLQARLVGEKGFSS
jgi:hypothetical protein